MIPKTFATIALAFTCATPVASCAELSWPKDSASNFAVAYLSNLYSIQAEQCSAFVPAGKVQNVGPLLKTLGHRLRSHADELLILDEFKRLANLPVPTSIVDTAIEEADRYARTLQSDTAAQCPLVILGLGVMTDDKDVILKNMLRNVMAGLGKSISATKE